MTKKSGGDAVANSLCSRRRHAQMSSTVAIVKWMVIRPATD